MPSSSSSVSLSSTRYTTCVYILTHLLLNVLSAGFCTASTNGFLTQSEVETAAENNEGVCTQDSLQLLFPSINFTAESPNITAWSFVATQNNDPAIEDKDLLQLQVWRPAFSNSYSLVAAVGDNSIYSCKKLDDRYIAMFYQHPAIPVSPGDVLGMYIPRFPKLFLRFRNVGVGNTTTYYFTTANIPQSYIATTAYTPGSQWIPFVAVQFGERSCCNLLMYILLHARSLLQLHYRPCSLPLQSLDVYTFTCSLFIAASLSTMQFTTAIS